MDLNPVFIPKILPSEAMDIVRDLRSKNLVQGVDFNFAYSQSKYDDLYQLTQPYGATFYFKESKWATFYRLKYPQSVT